MVRATRHIAEWEKASYRRMGKKLKDKIKKRSFLKET